MKELLIIIEILINIPILLGRFISYICFPTWLWYFCIFPLVGINNQFNLSTPTLIILTVIGLLFNYFFIIGDE